jgi:hypothetical protein
MVTFATVIGSSIPCLASSSFLGEMDERGETGYKAKKSLPVSSTYCLMNKNILKTSKIFFFYSYIFCKSFTNNLVATICSRNLLM